MAVAAIRSKEFHFPVSTEWIGERRVAVRVEGKQTIEITPPPEFRGTDPTTWSPEDLFVAAAASCLAVTFTGLPSPPPLPPPPPPSAGAGPAPGAGPRSASRGGCPGSGRRAPPAPGGRRAGPRAGRGAAPLPPSLALPVGGGVGGESGGGGGGSPNGMSWLARARETLHGLEQLLGLRRGVRRVAGLERAGDAVADVLVEDLERERLERRVDGGDLGEDVDAVAVVLDHPLDAAHLAFDAVQALDERVLVLRVAVDVGLGLGGLAHDFTPSRWLLKRLRRKELVTTNRLEAAIAAAAMIGFRRPATASGIAATL